MGVRVFQPEMLLVLAMYFPFFFVFFFSNSLRVNGAMRFSGQSENVSRLIGGLANSGGLILIIIIQYVVFLVDRYCLLDNKLAERKFVIWHCSNYVYIALFQ